jgi:tetratricopeptide (TPR) repeat protein
VRPGAIAAAAGAVLAAALIAGCATPQATALLAGPPAGLPPRVELSAVPFYPQEDYQCGPAALATTLVHAGVAVTPEELVSQVYLPARKGSLQAEMLAASRRHGLMAYQLAPRLEDLLREVADGKPVIVLQNLGFGFAPVSSFERSWARSQHWAMLTLPPERLPATVDEGRYLGAAAALERVAPAAARRAYAAALERWPDNLTARLGLGNASYAQRDLAGAEAAYREATRRHPAAADAWNNLAQALLELGRRDEALAAARRAVDIGGPRLARYQATLQAITGSR